MPTEDERRNKLMERSMEALAEDELSDQNKDELEALAEQIEEPGLQDRILERYLNFGKQLLADTHPTVLDPRVTRQLEPTLGDIGHIRVHTGPMATAAAEAMKARAFAIGDSDIFVAESHYSPGTREGVGLLAHEVHHAMDPSSGMGLSDGSAPRTVGEAEALHAELDAMEGVQEDAPVGTAPSQVDEPGEGEADIDIADMVRRVAEVLEARARHSGDLHGG